MHDFSELRPLLLQLAEALTQRGWMLATAESCTGGLIAAACTDLPGSSSWFDRGFVTYSNAAKTDMLGVPSELIERYGAVSEEVVCAMAQGALTHAKAQLSIAISGIAGPGGGSMQKPVGTVWIACASQAHIECYLHSYIGDRRSVRHQAAKQAVSSMLTMLRKPPH